MTGSPTHIRRTRASDIAAVRLLLSQAGLPTADVASAPGLRFWVLEAGDEVAGVIGMECAGEGALVRSLAVAPAYRSQGWGHELLATAEREARALGVRQLVLLTESAEAFFEARGYAVIDRRYLPEELRHSEQFRSLCPASAVCMTKALGSSDG